MTPDKLRSRLGSRLRRHCVSLDFGVTTKFEQYIQILTKWNSRINLTALQLDPLGDEAIDRLLVEPILAARHVRQSDRFLLDVGSGGGSPGIPLFLAGGFNRLVLVEVKTRKCAFLREVLRQLSMTDASVENCRFEELLSKPHLLETADVVSMRAVRPTRGLWNTAQAFLRPRGRVFWFGSQSLSPVPLPETLVEADQVSLIAASGGTLKVFEKN